MNNLPGATRLNKRIKHATTVSSPQIGHLVELRLGEDPREAHRVLAEAGIHNVDDDNIVIIQDQCVVKSHYVHSYPLLPRMK